MSHHLGITNTQQNTDFTNKNLSKIRMHVDEKQGATLLPFDTPLATPLGALTSSCECYITWESQTRNKTLILAFVFSFMTLRDATLLPFERPLATPLGILTSSCECYITWESQAGCKTPISAIDTHVRMHTFFRFYYSCIAKSEGVLGEMGECGCWIAALPPPPPRQWYQVCRRR